MPDSQPDQPMRIIAPSILASDFCALGDEIDSVMRCGAQWIHVDVMDGAFTKNLAVGIPIVKSVRKRFPEAFLDCHLMIERPDEFINEFHSAGASQITIHVESTTSVGIRETLTRIRALGLRAGIALKPHTPVATILPFIDEVDMVLVMTVEPGWGGQAFMHKTMETVRRVRAASASIDIQVDGGINKLTAVEAVQAGANVLVAGSAIFGLKTDEERAEAIAHMQNC